jgi:RimK family alpha-L-glutamate ligase
MRLAIVAQRSTETNIGLVLQPWAKRTAVLMTPREALMRLRPGDLALGRLDVRASVDGIEDGLWELERLAAMGIPVLNVPAALRAAHDKLLTARRMRLAGLPHPRTVSIQPHTPLPDLDFPAVVKPRFGSWGRDVQLCRNSAEFEHHLEALATSPWFRRTGAIAQELIPSLGHDLRVLVAGGGVVGAAKRIAARGEWRTNVALGGSTVPVEPSPVACELARAAAAAIGIDLVGVDLLPTGPGSFCVIELNGAVDFDATYSLRGGNVFAEAAAALCRVAAPPSVVCERGASLSAHEWIGQAS